MRSHAMYDWVLGNYRVQHFGGVLLKEPEALKYGVIYEMVKYTFSTLSRILKYPRYRELS